MSSRFGFSDAIPEEPDGGLSTGVSIDQPPPIHTKHTRGIVDKPVESVVDSKPHRITVHLSEDGTILWDRVKPSQVAELKASLKSDKQVADLFSNEHIELLTLETATTVVDALGKINTFIFMKVCRLHPMIAMQSFSYTPEQHERIDPYALTVINKYRDKLPDWMVKYQEEVQLATIIFQVTKEQLSAALQAQRELVIRMQEQEKQQPPQYRGNGSVREGLQ